MLPFVGRSRASVLSHLDPFSAAFITNIAGSSFRHTQAGTAGAELLKAAPNDYLQVWPVSKRVNSSRAPGDDPALIDPADA
jgi:hypothetical protein